MPRINITETALAQAIAMKKNNPNYRDLQLRLYLEGKGCDGFYYGVTFDKPAHDDVQINQGEIDILIDEASLTFCEGSTITWVDDERGKGFLIENPNQKKFRGKFFKRSAWQKRLTKQMESQAET